jgi:hypothetical protein
MSFTQAGQQVANQFYCQFPTQPDRNDLLALGQVINDWWEDFMKPLQATAVALVKIELTDLTQEFGEQQTFTTGLPQTGNMSGTALANHVTLSVKLATGFSGRSQRGRQYFIGLTSEQMLDPNHITLSTITALQDCYSALIDAVHDAGWTLVIASFYTDGARRDTAQLKEVISSHANQTVDSQRRRLPERGM